MAGMSTLPRPAPSPRSLHGAEFHPLLPAARAGQHFFASLPHSTPPAAPPHALPPEGCPKGRHLNRMHGSIPKSDTLACFIPSLSGRGLDARVYLDKSHSALKKFLLTMTSDIVGPALETGVRKVTKQLVFGYRPQYTIANCLKDGKFAPSAWQAPAHTGSP